MKAKTTATTRRNAYNSMNSPELKATLLLIEEGDAEGELPVLPYVIEAEDIRRFNYDKDDLGTKSFFRAFSQFLKEAIHTSTISNTKLLISSFKPFGLDTSLPLLQLLTDGGRPFEFLDFTEFDKDALKITIAVLERRKESSKEVKKESLPQKAAQKVQNSGHHLQNIAIKEKSIARKIHYAWMDVNNLTAMGYIGKLSTDYTLKDLAEALTNQGILTPKGKAHTPKSVSRLRERLSELPKLIKEPLISSQRHGHVMGAGKVLPVNLPNEVPDFTDKIVISFTKSINQKVTVEIFNAESKPNQPAFVKEYSAPLDLIKIDIREETVLIPGLHSIRLKAKGYDSYIFKATIFAELFAGISKINLK